MLVKSANTALKVVLLSVILLFESHLGKREREREDIRHFLPEFTDFKGSRNPLSLNLRGVSRIIIRPHYKELMVHFPCQQ